MAYGYYPGYQQYPNMQQYQQPQTYSQTYAQTQTVNPDERIWVQGEGAAQAYLVAPNSFVRLWDSQQAVFYEKRADQTGKPYMETYEYKRRGADVPNPVVSGNSQQIDYEAKIKALEGRIEALEKGVSHDE